MRRLRTGLAALLTASMTVLTASAHAETNEIRISRGFGIDFLPLIVMEHDHLVEKQAKAAGLDHLKVVWRTIDGGNNINDAMLAGARWTSCRSVCLVLRCSGRRP